MAMKGDVCIDTVIVLLAANTHRYETRHATSRLKSLGTTSKVQSLQKKETHRIYLQTPSVKGNSLFD